MKKLIISLTMGLTSFALCAAEQTETARTLTQSPISAVSLLQTFLGLALVLACIVLVAWLLKRTNSFHTAANGKLKVIAGLPLGTRERALLVQVGDEQLLLGVTSQTVSLLHKLDTPISVETGTQSDFAAKLRHIMQQRRED